ncbi:phosphotransferase [Anoxybacteroides tepidamans]|uniref:phosphotransferase n=1 Tax=Anoxybacteroides tepidamans TaxID=265948 RepID=UPI000485D9AB|nr:phosphotransferase [Anoxybacillus tepidamans]
MKNKEWRDEQHRLFLFLKAGYGLCVKDFIAVKPHVWIIDTNQGKWVFKKYNSFFEASRQMMFMRLLKKAGFQAAPSIDGIISFDSSYWTVQTYISKAKPLTFKDEADRNSGLELLSEYHFFSRQLLDNPFFRTMLPHYNLYEKWRQRYAFFLYHLPLWERMMKREELSFILQCANYFFEQYPKCSYSFSRERATIIHGDVASHNFLRTERGDIYLIDYDLMAVASSSIDYLQYASRVLPHVDWTLAYLEERELFQPLLEQRWFLISLVFPADVMRECRFFMRSAKRFSISDLEYRKQFVQKIMSMIR